MKVPVSFLEKMKALLGAEYGAYEACLEQPPFAGLRVNTGKISPEEFGANSGLELRPSPFCAESFYPVLKEGERGLGRHPWHHAGLFYLQEPAASSVIPLAGIHPGERVLDLCAAPGGKSTHAAARLAGRGLLWANEVVASRTGILSSNLERMGVANAVISGMDPETLCSRLEGFFDVVLVDAPCSGEGMMRKEPAAAAQWSPALVESCARRQLHILNSAKQALRPGGRLVYSTCTFSPEEDEELVAAFLSKNPDFSQQTLTLPFGRPGLDGKSCRIYPMDGGEGHFVAVLSREGDQTPLPAVETPAAPIPAWEAFAREHFPGLPPSVPVRLGDRVYLYPPELPSCKGLAVLRCGVLAGELIKGRFEPAHGLYLSLSAEQNLQKADFPLGSDEIGGYLKGEELAAPDGLKGFAAVCAGGYVTGFAKASDGRLKNRYPKGLRNL